MIEGYDMKVRCTQRCVQCIKYGVVCVFLICFAAFLPAQETDAAQNASVPENRWFQITNVQYDIKGMTKQYPLSRCKTILLNWNSALRILEPLRPCTYMRNMMKAATRIRFR